MLMHVVRYAEEHALVGGLLSEHLGRLLQVGIGKVENSLAHMLERRLERLNYFGFVGLFRQCRTQSGRGLDANKIRQEEICAGDVCENIGYRANTIPRLPGVFFLRHGFSQADHLPFHILQLLQEQIAETVFRGGLLGGNGERAAGKNSRQKQQSDSGIHSSVVPPPKYAVPFSTAVGYHVKTATGILDSVDGTVGANAMKLSTSRNGLAGNRSIRANSDLQQWD